MKTIWTLIALTTAAALIVIYRSNHPDERPLEVSANCKDSYPAVVTPIPGTANSDAKVNISCSPDRFIRTGVPERSL